MKLIRIVAVAVAAALIGAVLTACVASSKGPTGLTAKVENGSAQPTVAPPELTQEQVDAIPAISPVAAYVVGTPVELSIDGDIPRQGIVLTRTYASPLPEDTAATFAFFDPDSGAWTAVPSTLSADRTTLSALVHHLSLWDDVVAGTNSAITSVKSAAKSAGQTVAKAATALQGTATQVTKTVADAVQHGADALYWGTGKLLGTRIDAPECDIPSPDWLDAQADADLAQRDQPNNAIRFCMGKDPDDASVLVIKARVNRSFGFPYELGLTPGTVTNTSFDPSLASTLESIGSLDQTLGQSISQLGASNLVTGGQELDITIPVSAVIGLDTTKPVLHFSMPNTAQALASAIYQALVAGGLDKTVSAGSALVAVAGCASSARTSLNGDPYAAAPAILKCLLAGKSVVNTALTTVSGSKTAAKGLLSKITLALALAPAATNFIDFVAEGSINDSLRQVFIDVIKSKLHAPTVPGFPNQIQGRWCPKSGSDCFSLASLYSEYPNIALDFSESASDTPGAADYGICLEQTEPGGCDEANSVDLEYLPAGVGHSCDGCDPNYTGDHDTSKPRLLILLNHQQDDVIHDVPPLYRVPGS